MPYNHEDIQLVTNFVNAKFVGRLRVNVTYIDVLSYNNPNEISLNYNLETEKGIFYLNIKYNKRNQTITLYSTGNDAISLLDLGTMAPNFIAPYMSFEQDKGNALRDVFLGLN